MKQSILSEIEALLDIYSIEEVLEINDLSAVDALSLLYEYGEIELPNTQPVTNIAWEKIDTLVEPTED